MSLKVIGDRFTTILDGTASRVIEDALAQVNSTERRVGEKKGKKGKKRAQPWGYKISPENPLQFRECAPKGHRVRVDLFCSFQWPPVPDGEASEQMLVVRVWALDGHVCFRPEWDAESLKDQLGEPPARVMLRYHFDLANPGQEGPKYHLQLGGVPHGNEVWWLPKSFNLPRIAHPPTDIVLACEMIAANFFPEEYKKIRVEPTWVNIVQISQNRTLRGYHVCCHDVVTQPDPPRSLLETLWNPAD